MWLRSTCAALLLLLVGTLDATSTFQRHLPPPVDPETGGKLWVVLAAGSDSYYNYRHQADICHAYQIVKSHGVPDENIIVFMRDDIADNKENPMKGTIINRPNGPDVYKGVPKDYVGDNLDQQIFLDVLAGKEISVGSKKTLKTGKDDSIFVYFADHGAPGLVEFGNGDLKATDLNRVLKGMHKEHKYKQMVLYIEACESGSMFSKLLPKHINIFTTTASNPQESSYACYFVDKLDTYVGDCYSVNWMEDTDKADVNKETLQEQFVRVRKETNTSHVMEYGDLHLSNLTLSNIVGSGKGDESKRSGRNSKYLHSVPQYEVSKKILELKMAKTNSVDEYLQLQLQLDAHLDMRKKVKDTLARILSDSLPDFDIATIDPLLGEGLSFELTEARLDNCYYPLVQKFKTVCFPGIVTPGTSDFAYHSLRVFTSVCLQKNLVLDKVLASIESNC